MLDTKTKKNDDIHMLVMKKLIFISILPFFIAACMLPTSGNAGATGKKIQVKLRFEGGTDPSLKPGYMTTVRPGTGWDSPGDYYAKMLSYQWNDLGRLQQASLLDPHNLPQGFTSDGGRKCSVPYHTGPRLSFSYDGRARTHKIHLAVQGDISNTLGGLARFNFGRNWLYLNIPAGLNPETDIAVFTIKGYHRSVTNFEVSATFEGTEAKAVTATDHSLDLLYTP